MFWALKFDIYLRFVIWFLEFRTEGNEVRPFDLHALSTPPAFILSQDQTLNERKLRNRLLVQLGWVAPVNWGQKTSPRLSLTGQLKQKVSFVFIICSWCHLCGFQRTLKAVNKQVTTLSYSNTPTTLSFTISKYMGTVYLCQVFGFTTSTWTQRVTPA